MNRHDPPRPPRPPRPSRLVTIASALVVAGAWAAPQPASAQPPNAPVAELPVDPATTGAPSGPKAPVDPAKLAAQRLGDLVKRGTDACNAGDVDEGLPALRAAWAQHEDADLAVALAGCEIKASDFPAAADHLAFALRNKDDPQQRKALEASFVGVRARVGGVKVSVNVDGADVFAGERFVGTTPLPGEVYVPAGKSRISVKKPGYGELESIVNVPAQGTSTLTLDLAGEGAIATAQRFAPTRSRTPAIVLGALGLTVAGIGAALYATGAAKGSAADSLLAELETTSSQPCLTGAAGCQTLKSLRQGHDSFVNAGTGVLIGGGALLGAAIIAGLWAAATPAPTMGTPMARAGGSEGGVRVQVVPSVAVGSGSLLVQGSF